MKLTNRVPSLIQVALRPRWAKFDWHMLRNTAHWTAETSCFVLKEWPSTISLLIGQMVAMRTSLDSQSHGTDFKNTTWRLFKIWLHCCFIRLALNDIELYRANASIECPFFFYSLWLHVFNIRLQMRRTDTSELLKLSVFILSSDQDRNWHELKRGKPLLTFLAINVSCLSDRSVAKGFAFIY